MLCSIILEQCFKVKKNILALVCDLYQYFRPKEHFHVLLAIYICLIFG
jgi:hypothetical protein